MPKTKFQAMFTTCLLDVALEVDHDDKQTFYNDLERVRLLMIVELSRQFGPVDIKLCDAVNKHTGEMIDG